ncbi:ketoacyl-ACP synthase III family protein [Streptomyces sp. 184]|uniref:ketoacyl-ACP synthase III family protein n=1 Tax=Streptomyces sp. 184 TaxID=1827526 RepID=UPI003891D7A0
MQGNDVFIAGIGTAATESVATAEAVRQGWYDADERERGGLEAVTVAGSAPAPDLAVEAARAALGRSGHSAADIGAAFHAHIHSPGPGRWSAQHYINRHAVEPRRMISVEVRNGCVGFFSGLRLAMSHLLAGPEQPAALLTCADNFGAPSVHRWRACEQFVLADGGGALVLSRRRGFARVLAVEFATGTEPAPRRRGALGFRERMEYFAKKSWNGDGSRPAEPGAVLEEAAERALKSAGVVMDDIARVVHDGFTRQGLREVVLGPLGIEEERSTWEFTKRVGHAGPLDQIRGLAHVWESGDVTTGDRVLLLSCVPGMEAACAVVEILESADR